MHLEQIDGQPMMKYLQWYEWEMDIDNCRRKNW